MSDLPENSYGPEDSLWMRGLWMLVLAVLIRIAAVVLFVATVLQFVLMLIGKEKNDEIAKFGAEMADWFAKSAKFQTGASDDKPFPWAKWGA